MPKHCVIVKHLV